MESGRSGVVIVVVAIVVVVVVVVVTAGAARTGAVEVEELVVAAGAALELALIIEETWLYSTSDRYPEKNCHEIKLETTEQTKLNKHTTTTKSNNTKKKTHKKKWLESVYKTKQNCNYNKANR